MAEAAGEQAGMVPLALDAGRIEERQRGIHRWTVALIFRTLREIGALVSHEQVVTPEVLVNEFGVPVAQERLMGRWLDWLERDGFLIRRDDEYLLNSEKEVPEARRALG